MIISKISSANAKYILSVHKPAEMVDVKVFGEVQKPGTYPIEVGTTYRELLKNARPKRFADLTAICLDDSVQVTEIEVLALSEIRVNVIGEVAEPRIVVLKPGARVCELKSKVVVLETGDPGIFSSRRMLKNGEEISVPKRK